MSLLTILIIAFAALVGLVFLAIIAAIGAAGIFFLLPQLEQTWAAKCFFTRHDNCADDPRGNTEFLSFACLEVMAVPSSIGVRRPTEYQFSM